MIVVAGVTRSGLTLTMQMLHAGGNPCVGDYPSFEKHQIGQIPWEQLDDGVAVKLIDAHTQLPPEGQYSVIRLHRNPKEQALSFNKFMGMFGYPPVPIKKLMKSIRLDYRTIDNWACAQYGNMDLYFEYILADPQGAARKIQDFVRVCTGRILDAEAMARVVVQRSPKCYPGMLELELTGQDNNP